MDEDCNTPTPTKVGEKKKIEVSELYTCTSYLFHSFRSLHTYAYGSGLDRCCKSREECFASITYEYGSITPFHLQFLEKNCLSSLNIVKTHRIALISYTNLPENVVKN